MTDGEVLVDARGDGLLDNILEFLSRTSGGGSPGIRSPRRCCPVILTRGGPGAVVRGVIRVSPGQTLSMKVGQYGGNGTGNTTPGQGGWGATGNGGRGGSGANRDGGGGGSTQLMIASSTVAVAGGGGGAGNSYFTSLLQSGTIGRAGGDEADGRVIIRWQGTPQPPVCFDQTVAVPPNSPGVPVTLRCGNLSRPEYFRLVNLPDHGFLDNRIFQAGTMTYVPDHGYAGTDSLIFVTYSGGLWSAPATVTFRVG